MLNMVNKSSSRGNEVTVAIQELFVWIASVAKPLRNDMNLYGQK